MKIINMTLCALAATLFTSCFSIHINNDKRIVCKGEVETHEMNLEAFRQVVLNGSADLEISQAEACRVKVTANEEVFQYLDYRVEDGVLILETAKDGKPVHIQAKTFTVYLSAPLLESLTVNGAADAEMSGYTSDSEIAMTVNGAGDISLSDIKVPTLRFAVNGAGDLDAKGLDTGNLYVSVTGAGDIRLSGQSGYANFSVTGAGDIDARGLDCPKVDKHKSGAASIRLKK